MIRLRKVSSTLYNCSDIVGKSWLKYVMLLTFKIVCVCVVGQFSSLFQSLHEEHCSSAYVATLYVCCVSICNRVVCIVLTEGSAQQDRKKTGSREGKG